MISKVPFYLVTGFLGSGKTTLIKHFIRSFADSKKMAIIQNEFAEVNIDGRELIQTGKSFELLEINNGSVFCVCLLGSFVHSLSDFIQQHKPDLVILEASGLSDPINIGQIISSSPLRNLVWLAHTYTIIDALNFQKTIERVGRNLHQIRVADTIILNKCDLAIEQIIDINDQLTAINPFAKILETSFCDIELDLTIKFKPPVSTLGIEPGESSGRPDLSTVIVKSSKIISIGYLESFMRKYSLITYRIKGYVLTTAGVTAVQASFGQIAIQPVANHHYPTEIVLIGPEIDQKSVQQEFENLCSLN
jgi:G3E family GTPase